MTDTTPLPPLLKTSEIVVMRDMAKDDPDSLAYRIRALYEAARQSDRYAMQECADVLGKVDRTDPFLNMDIDAALQTLKDLGITPVIK